MMDGVLVCYAETLLTDFHCFSIYAIGKQEKGITGVGGNEKKHEENGPTSALSNPT